MNVEITRLFALFVVLFALLIAFTSRWTVFEADSLEGNEANRRPLLEQQRVPRGLILARDGTRLAVSLRRGRGDSLRYVRRYPTDALFSQVIGYSFIDRGQSGIERFRADELAGEEDEFTSLVDEFTGQRQEGDDVRTTLDPDAQRVALQALGGQKGAVAALEPSTGRVRVMASVPSYDPNQVPTRFARLTREPGSPLLNRVTQARYPPGSTMKVVTATAAIDGGKFNPESIVDGRSPKEIGGVDLQNFGGQSFGPVTLTQALTNSVNTVWGEVGEKVGAGTMVKYMERFGMQAKPRLDYPKDQLSASGVFNKGKPMDDGFDVGRVAIGQEQHLRVTPLQMAMVAGAIGNGGKLMRPRLTDRVVATDGRTKRRMRPSELEEVCKPETAQKVGAMMAKVVEEGSGTAAALKGVSVAGKTGTAETPGSTINQVWFVAFAPKDDPRIAIAVTVERSQGTGGEVAAPIAKRVLEELLKNG